MSFRVTQKSIRVRGKLLRVGEEVAVLHGPYVGRVGSVSRAIQKQNHNFSGRAPVWPLRPTFLLPEDVAAVGKCHLVSK